MVGLFLFRRSSPDFPQPPIFTLSPFASSKAAVQLLDFLGQPGNMHFRKDSRPPILRGMAQQKLVRVNPDRQFPKHPLQGPGPDKFNGLALRFLIGLRDDPGPLGAARQPGDLEL